MLLPFRKQETHVTMPVTERKLKYRVIVYSD